MVGVVLHQKQTKIPTPFKMGDAGEMEELIFYGGGIDFGVLRGFVV